MEGPFVRSAYNYDAEKASVESGLICRDRSLAQQNQRDESDINVIVKRFGVTGMLPQVAVPPTYGDFEGVSDYREALELIREADKSFNSLPADLRASFRNDPAEFLDWIESGPSAEDLKRFGLIPPDPVTPPGA